MAEYIGNHIVLNEEEWERFQYNALHPDPETIAKRDAFFKEIDETLHVERISPTEVRIEIPDI